jgi:hypothetical protein
MAKVAKKSAKSTTKSVKAAKAAKAEVMTAVLGGHKFNVVAKPKSEKKSTTKKAVTVVVKKSRAPNPLFEKLIALMLRPDGAVIADFQKVEGFNIPSMAVVKAAQRAGYEASASKKPGERTRYIARKAGGS